MELPYKKRIEIALSRFFSEKKREARRVSPEVYDAVCRLEEYTLRGGKRIRPILLIIGYTGYGGEDIDEIVRVSICVELLQSALLIHDDVMDHDEMRRGKPTIYASYSKKYPEKASENMAIDIGDIGLTFVPEPLIKSGFDAEIKARALGMINVMTRQTCYGQLLDIVSFTRKVNVRYIKKMHEYKTSRYTIAGPLAIGAMLAGADEQEIEAVNRYGVKLGQAYQLKDDIFGIFGSEKEVGKQPGADIKQGKRTLLVIKAHDKYIESALGKKCTLSELGIIRERMIKSGSLGFSLRLIERLSAEARKCISLMGIKREEEAFLEWLVDYVKERRV